MENKTTSHTRDTNGNVADVNPFQKGDTKRDNGIAKFLGGVATTMALALALTGLLLHASIQTNAAHNQQIQELRQTVEEQNELLATNQQTIDELQTAENNDAPIPQNNPSSNWNSVTPTLDQNNVVPAQQNGTPVYQPAPQF
jgi:cell division protein FtsL